MAAATLVLAAMLPAAQAFAFSPSLGSSFACKGSLTRSCPAAMPLATTRAQTRSGVLGVKAVAQEVAQLHAALHSIDPATVAAIHADAMMWMNDAQQLLADAAAAAPAAAADAVADADKPGLFGNFVNLIQGCLVGLHSAFKSAGIPGAWGLSIAVFTIFIKGITYPLNYKQMASTMQMQSLQPKLKALQARYANDPQTMNEKTAQLYKDEQVNPLAGCLPTLVQIPVFIGLYRSVLELAKKDMLEESFLWLPSLQGPVGEYNLKTGLPIDATAWLFKGWTDGHPALGWSATAAYISIPIILVITQSISQKLLQPPASDDPAQQQTQQILKFLPLMIGWFALNVPAGLGVYWVINNFLSTSQQWWIRQQFKDMQPASNGPSASSSSAVDKPIKAMPLREVEGFSVGSKKDAVDVSVAEVTASEESSMEDGDEDDSKLSRSAMKKMKKAKGKRK
eukprot:CAMPEP_0177704108 /NCGR_PEP_ID=MMETSP0484_2-20121128/8021_1 /TAXON_ID=354590 /ORGANISM="Rhodomonas lens, Strain RHODO" /LENGTH=452 /DNA_ID=CAMNT_0019215491 /DNA_START=39 /DNA_END=1397 /DNA_ORIENTATION=-